MKSFIYKSIASLGLLLASFGFASAQVTRPPVDRAPAVERPALDRTPVATTTTPRVTTSGVLTLAQAEKLFRDMASQRDIAFRYVKDGCYARAQLMIERMIARGIQPVRVWSFGNGENLHVRTRLEARGFVEWWYHVAPAVAVHHNGKTVYMVIDPSMFDKPVTTAQWLNAQKRTTSSRPMFQVTKLGQPPINPKTHRAEGSGYWPDKDPVGGAHAHAVSTMRMYKPKERG
ncbi:MAG: protein-glutamine glutaminase family protein [Gemmataceae bacterium]